MLEILICLVPLVFLPLNPLCSSLGCVGCLLTVHLSEDKMISIRFENERNIGCEDGLVNLDTLPHMQ